MADIKNELDSMIQRLRDFVKSTDEAGASVVRLKAALSGVGGGGDLSARIGGGKQSGLLSGSSSLFDSRQLMQMERDLTTYRRIVEKATELQKSAELVRRHAEIVGGPSPGLRASAQPYLSADGGPSAALRAAVKFQTTPISPYAVPTTGAAEIRRPTSMLEAGNSYLAQQKLIEATYDVQIKYERQLTALVEKRLALAIKPGAIFPADLENQYRKRIDAMSDRSNQQWTERYVQRFDPQNPNRFDPQTSRQEITPERARELTLQRGIQADLQTVPQSREQILSQYANVIPGGAGGLDNINKKLQELGVNAAHVTGVTRELSSGITSMNLRMNDASGAVIQGSVHMDKFGNILNDTGRRFRSFADSVSINITKVVQWAVATSLVYATLRGIQSLMSEMTRTQAELANIQVALGGSTSQLNAIFEESARVADLTSSSTLGVLEGYALAYRAAGSVADENQRILVSNNLLTESMTLAKLAGIDQATAMDILVGALRQTGKELTEGRDLIDKWVYISRVANVSLETLAQTYSIVGASAEGVGITMEQLNALTATLAESTGLSATETGNAVRGIIAGFQSASAEKTLARFGIATRSATGELRDFYDLYLQIADLTQSGILSDRDISEIANAIGGGYRRGAQVQVLLQNATRTRQLEAQQAYAGGSAAAALEIQMITLESAITRLGNAFTKFAQTLGSQGGFASLMTMLVSGFTEMLELINAMASGMGKATPIILAYTAAWAFLNSTRGQNFLASTIGPDISAGIAGITGKMTQEQMIAKRAAEFTGATAPGFGRISERVGGGISKAFTGRSTGMGEKILGYGVAGINVGTAAAEGDFEKAGISLVGTIVGGLIGSATIVGAPVGAAIGSIAASAFYEAVDTDSSKFRQLFVDIFAIDQPTEKPPGEQKTKEELEIERDEKLAEIIDQMSFSTKANAAVAAWIGNTFTGKKPQIGNVGLTAETLITGTATGNEQLIQQLKGWGIEPTPEQVQALSDLLEDTWTDLLEAGIEKGAAGVKAQGAIPELAASITGVFDDFINEQLKQLTLGTLSPEDYRTTVSTMDTTKLATQLSNVTTAAGFSGMAIDVQDFAKYMLELDEATRGYVSTLGEDVLRKQDVLVDKRETGTMEERAVALREYTEAVEKFNKEIPALQMRKRITDVPRLQVFDVGRATPQQVQAGMTLAKEFQRAYFLALADGNEELANWMEKQVEPLLIKSGEGLGTKYGEAWAVGAQYATEAFKELNIQTEAPQFGFQDLRKDLSMQDIPALMARYQKVVGSFQQNFPQYDIKEQDVGLITKNGLTTVTAELSLLNLAMQDLIDVNEQQLEGVWNIPSGMTAFIAWTSAFSRTMPSGGTSVGEGPFNEDRKDKPLTQIEEKAALEAELTKLDTTIASMEKLLTTSPWQYGMQEKLAMKGDLVSAKERKGEITQQLQSMQLAQSLGIQQQPGVNVVDQLREALTVQSKIELNANIRLVVDGRTLANIVKQYLFEDLTSAANKSAGTGAGQYVVGGH